MNRLKKHVKTSMVLNSFNRRFLDELDMYQITKLLIEMKDAANLEDTIHDISDINEIELVNWR